MKGFYDFLKGTEGVVFGNDIYFKGAPIKIKKDFFAYPVYVGHSYRNNRYSIPDIPEEARFSGVYIPEKRLYISDAYNTEDFKDDGLSVLSFYEIKKDFSKRVVNAIEDWMENEDIEAGVPNKMEVYNLFESGVFDIDIGSEKRLFKDIVEKRMQNINIDYLSYVSGIMQEYEDITADMMTQAEDFIRIKKANKKLLIQFVEDAQKKMEDSGGQEADCRRRKVLNVFKSLEKAGNKTCTVSFDFAGKMVKTKVSLADKWKWVNGTRKATAIFEADNYMPISMPRYGRNINHFLPFAVRIEIRDRCYYEAQPLDVPKENLLYQELLSSEKFLDMEYLENKYPSADCSIPLYDGDEVAVAYINICSYTTEDGFRYLLRHNADKESVLYKILEEEGNCSRGCYPSIKNVYKLHDILLEFYEEKNE